MQHSHRQEWNLYYHKSSMRLSGGPCLMGVLNREWGGGGVNLVKCVKQKKETKKETKVTVPYFLYWTRNINKQPNSSQKMTSILHNKIGMQSGDTQGHDVRGHAGKDKKQIAPSSSWINHTGSLHMKCYSHDLLTLHVTYLFGLKSNRVYSRNWLIRVPE